MTTLTFTKRFLSLVALMGIVLMATGLHAQDLVNGSAATILNKGTIKFISADGEFQNDNAAAQPLDNTAGVVEFVGATNLFTDAAGSEAGAEAIGLDDTRRLTGEMVYSSAAAAQDIQGRFYTNLEFLNAAQKDFSAVQVNVSEIYTAADGARDYGTSTFIYDGDAAQDQDIFAEGGASGGTNIYYTLHFAEPGIKTLLATQTNNVEFATEMLASNTGGADFQGIFQSLANATFLQNAAAPLTVSITAAEYRNNGGAATFNGAVTVTDGTMSVIGAGNMEFATGGSLTLATTADVLAVAASTGNVSYNGTTNVGGVSNLTNNGDGNFIISTGTVNMNDGTFAITATGTGQGTINSGGTFNLTAAAGIVDIAAAQTLQNTGVFTNSVAMGSRVNMVFDATSNMIYDGAQAVVGTDFDDPYGNVAFTTAVKSGTDGDVNMMGNLNVNHFDLPMDANGGHILAMMDWTKTATYGVGFEVVGAMKRYFNHVAGYAATDVLTYNNEATKLTLTDNIANLTDFTLETYPSTVPEASDYSAVTDVLRRIRHHYTEVTNNWEVTLQVGYKVGEEPTDGNAIDVLRYREYVAAGNASEKVSTSILVARTPAYTNGFANISLAGIVSDDTGELDEITTNQYLFLSGAATSFITIADGRWSNPATWDEGAQPTPADVAIVKHTVHVGFRRDDLGEGGAGQINEETIATNGVLAQTIELIETDGAGGFANPSLIFGHNNGGAADEAFPISGAWRVGTIANTGLLTNNNTGTLGGSVYTDAEFTHATTGIYNTSDLYEGLYILRSGTKVELSNFVNNGNAVVGVGAQVAVGE